MSANKRKKLNKTVRRMLYEKYNHKCAYCGCELEYDQMTADHLKPLERNGIDDISNILPACFICNNFKDHFTLTQFRQNILNLKYIKTPDKIQSGIISKYNINSNKIIFYFETQKG